MENKRRGKLYIISGPSGTGKSTIIEKVRQYRPELTFSVSATTRLPRKGDVEGVTYYFKTNVGYGQQGRPVSFGTSLIFDL